ncbi:hypothetical protein E2C01_014982 [Portunus trituberculatus]|uniref:Uncharacterized protein n=1 Tax=Portunus trituberculatus TaxID=210409 RepID=A0A5B7DLL8_PORTR|nr:hypothetical protein [Portunus trituberculatus]
MLPRDLKLFIPAEELPPYKGVVVWVTIGGYEGAAPVSVQAEALKVFNAARWEVTQPVVLVSELLNLTILQPKTLHDLPLVLHASCLGCSFALGKRCDTTVKVATKVSPVLAPGTMALLFVPHT